MNALIPLTLPLHESLLIEASAGTGKTWTIASLYVRLILGHGQTPNGAAPLAPRDILVLTFTRAATRELVERIRQRLVQALACFNSDECFNDECSNAIGSKPDEFLQDLLQDYPSAEERRRAASLLDYAVQNMDEAAIFTIDGWCQRVLREHALSSDSVLMAQQRLDPQPHQRQQQAARDYWRQNIYPLELEQLERVQQVWATPQNLPTTASPLSQSNSSNSSNPQYEQTLAAPLAELLPLWSAEEHQALQALAQPWRDAHQVEKYRSWIDEQITNNAQAWNRQKLQARHYQNWFDTLQTWAEAPYLGLAKELKTGATRLIPSGLRDSMSKKTPKSAPEPELPPQAHALEALLTSLEHLPSLEAHLNAHARMHIQRRLRWLQEKAATFTFDDMLRRLDAALNKSKSGNALRQSLLAQYPVALVDEFQDTSTVQYRIFERIYRPHKAASNHALLMIGDPKQSIYSFRGADLNCYFQARNSTGQRHYALSTNYRSTPDLVQAVNNWFSRPAPFAMDQALEFVPVKAQGIGEVLVRSGQPISHALQCQWFDGKPNPTRQAQRCAHQLVQWLNDPSMGFVKPDQDCQDCQDCPEELIRLRPRDIAILVRNSAQASLMRKALSALGMASAFVSERESVFATAEAQDLLYWLRGVCEPLSASAVRSAFATRLVDWSIEQLEALSSQDARFDACTEALVRLKRLWQSRGVMAMLRSSLSYFADIQSNPRRLTNVLHLSELLQNASAQHAASSAVVRWLEEQINLSISSSENQTNSGNSGLYADAGAGLPTHILRLESDADLVQISTIHASKGLEYPLVMLPFASLGRHSSAQQAEELPENLRLLYVAMTRPRHLLWLGLGELTSGSSEKREKSSESNPIYYLLEAQTAQEAKEALRQRFGLIEDLEVVSEKCEEFEEFEEFDNSEKNPETAPPEKIADFDRSWSVSSFSSITQYLSTHLGANFSAGDTAADISADISIWHTFARGALVGNFVHEQLQWWAHEGFADLEAPVWHQRLHQRCTRAGYSSEEADQIALWLNAIGQHELAPLNMRLTQLQPQSMISEMEFWMPIEQLDIGALDDLCRQYLLPEHSKNSSARLSTRQLRGMLMGFADLTFEYQGRYWVLDYKTNYLGASASAYTDSTLMEAVCAHRYDVQAAIYSLALHRLLRARLGKNYKAQEHMGGALLFFLRGLDKNLGSQASVHLAMLPEFLEKMEMIFR